MEKNLHHFKARRRGAENSAEAALLAQLRETSVRLENAYTRFDYEQNADLQDAVIYEIQSLRALYRYLFKAAQAAGLECAGVQVFGREGV